MEDDIKSFSNEGIQVFKQLKYFKHPKHQRDFSNLGNIYVALITKYLFNIIHEMFVVAGSEIWIVIVREEGLCKPS